MDDTPITEAFCRWGIINVIAIGKALTCRPVGKALKGGAFVGGVHVVEPVLATTSQNFRLNLILVMLEC